MDNTIKDTCILLRGAPELHPGTRLGKGPEGEGLVAGPLLMGSARAQPEMATRVYPPARPSPAGGSRKVGCSVERAAGEGRYLGVLTPGFANWLLERGLSPQLVREVERY